jgi:photosystem II stability/assembly factor-like uncharacterized protein
MSRLVSAFGLFLLLGACNRQEIPERFDLELFQLSEEISIRALHVVSENEVWLSGNLGRYAHTTNGGETWKLDSLRDFTHSELRGIWANEKGNVYLMRCAAPAAVLHSADYGQHWTKGQVDADSSSFYDALAFWNEKAGIVFGDPKDGCFDLYITENGGMNWTKIDCKNLPSAMDGEAAFASSNSNVHLFGSQIRIATGGKLSRLLLSEDSGNSWQAFAIPLSSGAQMTGTFSMDFYDEMRGIAVGGNYEKPEITDSCVAITTDGGRTWKLSADSPGQLSCVRYIPGYRGEFLMACSRAGVFVSRNGGFHWERISEEAFHTLRPSADGKVVWFAGPAGRVGVIRLRD